MGEQSAHLNKTCSRCKENLTKSEFCKRARSRDGLSYVCKACSKSYMSQKYSTMDDAARRMLWRSNNAAFRVRCQGGVVERVCLEGIYSRDNGICYLCGKEVAVKDLEYDHKTPISRGGNHTSDNIGVTHKACNREKNTKTPEEYLAIGASA